MRLLRRTFDISTSTHSAFASRETDWRA